MPAADPDDLVLTEWTLDRVEPNPLGVEPADFPHEVGLRVSADHVVEASDGCNWLSGRLTGLATGVLTSRSLLRTLVRCSGLAASVQDLVRPILISEPAWRVEGEELVLRSDEAALTYRRRLSVFPSDRPGRVRPQIVSEGRRGSGDYRFSYSARDNAVQLYGESRDALGQGWSHFLFTFTHDTAGTQPRPDHFESGLIDGQRYLAGVAAPPATRIVFTPSEGQAHECVPIPLPQAPDGFFAVVEFIGTPRRDGSTVTLYDGDGRQVGSAMEIYWWEPGDPV